MHVHVGACMYTPSLELDLHGSLAEVNFAGFLHHAPHQHFDLYTSILQYTQHVHNALLPGATHCRAHNNKSH